jgi:hypothetical protein
MNVLASNVRDIELKSVLLAIENNAGLITVLNSTIFFAPRNTPGSKGMLNRGSGGSTITVCPGDIIFGDIDGVVVIPKDRLRDVAETADELGKNEATARDRILSGEKLQSVWPA